MKFGMRKPSIKKSFKARTTGKVKRKLKSSVNPFYGKKGMGYIHNPKKAVYNKVYHKTTFGIPKLFSLFSNSKSKKSDKYVTQEISNKEINNKTFNNENTPKQDNFNYTQENESVPQNQNKEHKKHGCLFKIIIALIVLFVLIALIESCGSKDKSNTALPQSSSVLSRTVSSNITSSSKPVSSKEVSSIVSSLVSSSETSSQVISEPEADLQPSENDKANTSEEDNEDNNQTNEQPQDIDTDTDEEPDTEPIAESPNQPDPPAKKGIEVVQTDGIARGSNATIGIQAEPNTNYSISVIYPSGPSKASGLESKTSDGNGNVSWTWKIGTKTTPGSYSVSITGGGETKNFTINVV